MNVKSEICKAFHRHASEYEAAARIQKEIGERLFERLDYLKITPRYILDLGCGPGFFLKRLKKYYPKANVIGCDLALGMLQQAKRKQAIWQTGLFVNGDMDAMPFASGVFDLVFANQVIHWSSSLRGLMGEINRVMNPGGCLMFSTLGPDTFCELRRSWSDDAYAHVNDFMDMHDLGDAMIAEHFLDPVVDMERLTAHYASCFDLVRSLKSQGVRNINQARHSGLTGKQSWRNFEQNMTALSTDEGRFPLSYEVVYGHAWKGELRSLEQGIEARISINTLRETYHLSKNNK